MFARRLLQAIGIILSLYCKRKLTGPVKMRIFFETMAGAFMRLGQILSMRQDFLSHRYADELLKVLNQASPLPYSQIRRVFIKEKGAGPEVFFAEFDEQPIASTPGAQIYKARLKNGEKAAVKIQRPEAKTLFETDYQVMLFLTFIADFFRLFSNTPLQEIVSEFICWSKQELDFTIEAQNGYTISQHSVEHPRTVIPRQFIELSSAQIIVQEFIEDGISIYDFLQGKKDNIDAQKLSYYLVIDIMRQYFVDGFFHADPHPTNIIFLPDGKVAYLDFGIVGKSQINRLPYLKVLHGIASGDPDYTAENLFDFGEKLIGEEIKYYLQRSRKEKESFDKIFGQIRKLIINDLKKEAVNIFNLKKIGEKYNICLPREIVLHLRVLSSLNAIALEISPDFDIIKALRYFFEKYPVEKIEEMTAAGEHEKAHEEIIGFGEKTNWRAFREILALEKEKRALAREKFIEMLGYYAEKYKDLRSSIKKVC